MKCLHKYIIIQYTTDYKVYECLLCGKIKKATYDSYEEYELEILGS